MSVVGNGGFESAMVDHPLVLPQPIIYGNWATWQSYGSVKRPHRVTTEKYSGDYSCRIEATVGTGSGGWILQDFTPEQVDPGQGFFLRARVKPVLGHEYMNLIFDYDRGPGTSAGVVTLTFHEDHTDFVCLGQSQHSAPVVPRDGAWHEVAVRGYPDLTSEFLIDNVVQTVLPAGTVPSYSVATVLIGEGTGLAHDRVDDFYWDAITLDFNPFPDSGAAPLLRRRQVGV